MRSIAIFAILLAAACSRSDSAKIYISKQKTTPEPTEVVPTKESRIQAVEIVREGNKYTVSKKSAKKTVKPSPTPDEDILEILESLSDHANETLSELEHLNYSSDNETLSEESSIPAGTEDLCVRIHNNTAFAGAEPFDTVTVKNAHECQKLCVASFPRCVAVMFYFVHGQKEDHLCYLFEHNSIDPDIQLISEKPRHKRDVIRALEIVLDCHQFDPFPPLGDDGVVASTDKVPRSKRESGSFIEVETSGPWTNWGSCTPSGVQARSQACEYGRKIQRRGCPARAYQAQQLQQQYQQQAQQHQQQQQQPQPQRVPTADDYYRQEAERRRQDEERRRQEEERRRVDEEHRRAEEEHRQRGEEEAARRAEEDRKRSEEQYRRAEEERRRQDEQRRQQTAESQVQLQVAYPPQQYAENHDAQRAELERQRLEHQKEYERRQQEYQRLLAERQQLEADRARQQGPPAAPPAPVNHGAPTYAIGEEQLHPAVPSAAPCENNICAPTATPQRRRPPPPPAPACKSQACIPAQPLLGEWLEWSEWSLCSCTCDDGIKQRVRECSTGNCGPGETFETAPCNMGPCQTWSDWCEWTPCSSTCGGGQKTRTRYCLLGTQRCEGPDYEAQPCDSGPCPEWSQWADWGQCSVTCGHGIQSRERTCLGSPSGNDRCNGDAAEQRPCEQGPCSVWSDWCEWSPCSATCGDGVRRRERVCQGGVDCIGESVEDIFCGGPPCADWSQWQLWSPCTVTCGPGQRTRTRSCLTPDGLPTENCIGEPSELNTCYERTCASWSDWCEWSPCDRDCGGGVSIRSRVCEAPGAAYGDNSQCPGPDRETNQCNQHPCAPQCQWTEWCPWSPCTALTTCETGISQRSRQCVGEAGCQCRGLKEESQPCHGDTPCTPLPALSAPAPC